MRARGGLQRTTPYQKGIMPAPVIRLRSHARSSPTSTTKTRHSLTPFQYSSGSAISRALRTTARTPSLTAAAQTTKSVGVISFQSLTCPGSGLIPAGHSTATTRPPRSSFHSRTHARTSSATPMFAHVPPTASTTTSTPSRVTTFAELLPRPNADARVDALIEGRAHLHGAEIGG
ncbi:hypothetical protein EJ06DRAFT_140113 [Trichodelitschia bisporula]|uniref:Uncharacterized protein n=1 Tax=Trichodelitschia bisporula TaxID=703511 RepID=A0A6G1HPI4_9PEZI|nr:hypothetical protein EJ06DRAFT_140113 [Trichodelitschia bisporula]